MSLKVAASITKNHLKVTNNFILDIDEDKTFLQILKENLNFTDYSDNALIQVVVNNIDLKSEFTTDLTSTPSSIKPFVKVAFIHFKISEIVTKPKEPLPPKNDAFKQLMAGGSQKIQPLKETDQKIKLHNELAKDFAVSQGYSNDSASDALKLLSESLWYLDGRWDQIERARSDRGIKFPNIPQR